MIDQEGAAMGPAEGGGWGGGHSPSYGQKNKENFLEDEKSTRHRAGSFFGNAKISYNQKERK